MLRLNIAQGPFWLILAHGVRVEVLPLTTETRIRASQDMRDPEGKMDDDGVKRDLAWTKSVARSVIIAWEGVGDENGDEVPVSPQGVDALIDIYDMFHAFQSRYILPGLAAVTEGNGSAPLPSGTSEAATTTAVPATPPARRARASSTRRKA